MTGRSTRNLKGIQFIGTQRSGSNLLRVMLNQLPEISAPHPPHILKTFFPLLPIYGDLKDERNFMSLVDDVCHWVNLNPVPWDHITFHAGDIRSRCRNNTLIEAFKRIYEQKAMQDNARFWCCKSMESVNYFNALEDDIRPHYIHIYRDGRDVALSFMKAIVGPKHVYPLAIKWMTEQQLALDIKDAVGDRYIAVSYEELLHDETKVMHQICSALGVHYSDRIFEYFKSEESKATASSGKMWENVTKPIIHDNFNKFRKEFTEEQLLIFESVAGDMLERLGYRRITPKKHSRPFDHRDLEAFKLENERLMRKAREDADPVDVIKRTPQENLLKQIMERKKIHTE